MSDSDFQAVSPATIDDTTLVSTSVTETVPLYNAGTTYALGDQVRSDATHRIYESLAGSNLGNPLTDAAKWMDIGPTNPWAMFDDLNSSQTTATGEIVVVITPGQRVDTIGLLNIRASSVTIVAEDATDGVVFDQTFDLVSTSGVVDWYTYYTEPVDFEPDKVISGLPALYSNLTFTITLSFPGETVRCGALVIGLADNFGMTGLGASTGIIDYSRKVTDDFGNTSVAERGYANKGGFKVLCDNVKIASVQRKLADRRAMAILYIGSTAYSNTFVYGFYRDFSIVIEYANHSILNIEIEGLL